MVEERSINRLALIHAIKTDIDELKRSVLECKKQTLHEK